MAPTLWDELGKLAERWVALALARLHRCEIPRSPKTFNDPIWGTIVLSPWEVLLLDCPLLQRLRGIRQLGMVHQVYHSAGFDRLEHTRGVIEAAERIIQSLERNAQRRRDYGQPQDRDLPLPSAFDRATIRLAALLHDIGHGPFSHATEPLIGDRFKADFRGLNSVLRQHFPDVTKFAVGEMIAIVLIMSEALRAVFEHPGFEANSNRTGLAPAIVSHVLGSRVSLTAPYLSSVISGPLDADKLDYMARDSYHAGLPVALDTNRLINMLEVVAITPENVANPTLRKRAEEADARRYYDVGISVAGQGAYEQMIVGRVILFDRMYYHHKVRAAEAMVRKLIEVAEQERGRPFTLPELFFDLEDDGMADLFAGRLRAEGFEGGKERALGLGRALRERRLYHRAYAVAKRFIHGFEGMDPDQEEQNRIYRWNLLLETLIEPSMSEDLEEAIFRKAQEVLGALPELVPEEGGAFCREYVVLDVPFNKTAAPRGSDILMRSEDGQLSPPNLFFDPERWSNAYREQKQSAFIFTPKPWVPLVSLASRIVFFERFRVAMSGEGDRLAKTSHLDVASSIQKLLDKDVCSFECHEVLVRNRPQLVPFRSDEFRKVLPEDFTRQNPDLAANLADGLQRLMPEGAPSRIHAATLETLRDLTHCLTTLERGGKFAKTEKLDEKRGLQVAIRDCLRARGVPVEEAPEMAGGETDLIIRDVLVVENKVAHQPLRDPFGSGPHFVWQARRYAMTIFEDISIVILGYKPIDELAHLPLSKRIRVMPPESGPVGFAQIRIVVPYGYKLPHEAKAPASP